MNAIRKRTVLTGFVSPLWNQQKNPGIDSTSVAKTSCSVLTFVLKDAPPHRQDGPREMTWQMHTIRMRVKTCSKVSFKITNECPKIRTLGTDRAIIKVKSSPWKTSAYLSTSLRQVCLIHSESRVRVVNMGYRWRLATWMLLLHNKENSSAFSQ